MIASVAALWNFMLWLPWQVDCVAGDGGGVRLRLQIRARGIAVMTRVTQRTDALRDWFFQGIRQPRRRTARAARPHSAVVEGDVPHRRRLLLDARLSAGHRVSRRRRARAHRDGRFSSSSRSSARCRSTAGSPRPARTARAASRCSKTCCRAGAARRSSWCCSDSPRPTSSSPSRCRRPTRPSTSFTTRSCRAAFDHPGRGHARAADRARRGLPERLQEAIGLAVVIVAVYLALNVVVIGRRPPRDARASRIPAALDERARTRSTAIRWRCCAVALLLFPKLALGLSGFETGVAVMPLVQGDPGDTPDSPPAASATPGSCCAPPRSS